MEDESPGQRTVEVAIPNVGTFVIESEEGGYDDEVALAPDKPSSPLFLFSFFFCAEKSVPVFDIYGVRASLPIHTAPHKVFHT